MLIAQNRTGIKFDARWFQNMEDRNVITQIGEMSMRAAINELKSSYFDSIGRYALEVGSVVAKEFEKLEKIRARHQMGMPCLLVNGNLYG